MCGKEWNVGTHGWRRGGVRPEITQVGVLCPVHEDKLVKGLKGRRDMVAFVFQRGHWPSCGGDKTGSRETGGEG